MYRPMMAAVWCVAAGLLQAAAPEPATFYVATNGRDAWSGRRPAPAQDGADGPFATVDRARLAGRGLRRPVRIVVRGGVYRLARPIVLTPEDSGTEQWPRTYEAYPGERPVLSGGRAIAGWRKGPGPLWTASIPEVSAGRWRFLQLFVNGQRRPRARTPNEGYFRIVRPVVSETDGKPSKSAFVFEPGDVRQWDRLGDVAVVLMHSWETSIHPIKSVDTDANVVEFAAPVKEWWKICHWEAHARYYVENAYEALDQPGEWYLDRSTGVLSYYPMPGEDVASAEVVAPRLTELLRVSGEGALEALVEHVTFKGLSFQHNDWVLMAQGNSSTQAAVDVPAAVMVDGARQCRFEDCEIAHCGTYGLWMRRGCKDCQIVRCHIHDLGAGGVRIGEARMARMDMDETQRTGLDNSYIHDGGHVFAAGVGVWIAQSSHNAVTHNEVHSFNYSGMSVGWNWNEAPNRTHHNLIEHNHVHHVMRGVLSDGAGIYTLGTQPGMVIRNNVFHDVFPYMGNPAMAWGIYMDQGSNQLLIENNIVYNTLTGGIMNTGHPQNVIRNNIFAFSGWHAAWRYTWVREPSSVVERNIFYLTQGDLFHSDGGAFDFKTRWDHNLYWRTDDEEMLFYDHSLQEWQDKGLGAHSQVADPRFVAPEQYDFRLRPDSPAFKLGFKPIDASQAGLYGDSEWTALPGKCRFPPTKLPPVPGPVTVDDDFEDTPVGATPALAKVYEEGKGDSVRVTDQTAAGGRRSLRFTDVEGLERAYNPHMHYTPNFRKGMVRQSFDLRLGPGADLAVEWRDSTRPYRVGPSLRIDPTGQLLANGEPLRTLPTGVWIQVEITCALGRQANAAYDLVVQVPNEPAARYPGLRCGHVRFTRLTWLGFVSLATGPAVFDVDNMCLAPVEPAGP